MFFKLTVFHTLKKGAAASIGNIFSNNPLSFINIITKINTDKHLLNIK